MNDGALGERAPSRDVVGIERAVRADGAGCWYSRVEDLGDVAYGCVAGRVQVAGRDESQQPGSTIVHTLREQHEDATVVVGGRVVRQWITEILRQQRIHHVVEAAPDVD